ncbi:MAG: HIT domain-containing protein [Planctomycetota bacterium]
MKHSNLWAPWRINYIQALADKTDCFLCDYASHPKCDDDNLVLWRTSRCLVVLNKFPYNNGHLLIAPLRHIAEFDQADDAELLELNKLVRESKKALTQAIHPHGFNVGMNFGRCAGAGLPDHLHAHLVPRWDGDTNFMSICSHTDVISQSLTELFSLLKDISKKQNLPGL